MSVRLSPLFRHALALVLLSAGLAGGGAALAANLSSKEKLGEALFSDTALSANRTQSCADCHNPDFGFADPRTGGAGGAASVGDNGKSVGDRNAPTAAYAAFTPAFHIKADGKAVGGQFWDGRAATLKDQAGGPPLNPAEMGLTSKEQARDRLAENPDYARAFVALYGAGVLDDAGRAYDAMTDSLAAFEKTDRFALFDSKYDRYLRGDYKMTPEEDLGMTLFFSTQFTNCNQCHKLKAMPAAEGEMFTNYEHHNIGVPANPALREASGKPGFADRGLHDNPAAAEPAYEGKFKTPTLRNVAVTGPYMHNGVFKDLETVVRFYDHYNNRTEKAAINPETGKPWGPPEVAANLSTKELESAPALDTRRVKALVAFMKTLTDSRYEHLLAK
ncbi:methylamine utilization protein MauG [Azospirillum sp. TSH7]|uniref:cytochrome-c peroxidase n=1 Tax=unclassified Azospirillum TaxID=2630922 RepID=UPI000D60E412|nr:MULTISPECIES: cytochrome c peroxidase [unclassified Azospirillum]PWC59743.1 methylamine utilization protein MauG [Azospirillum sp. TSH7]PWC71447.1 methylamine utilization protein MauG [Azospirillum sp. TSH20]